MTMKQTQTKLFEFSDVGLDFCAGSKNLFPDRFKKMLSLGYNEQTVSSVAVTGNQVVLTYGVNHGYVADRVLKITSGALAAINGGEFWIDSVTENTVTLTIDNAPLSIAGGFTTKIASLGWNLVYEKNNIQIYKMLHIDNTDRFVRFCFQNNPTHRNAIAISIGKTCDLASGAINDINALQITSAVVSPSTVSLPRWDFSFVATSNHDNWTYSQGVATYGRGVFIGSIYHFAMLNRASNGISRLSAILPVITFDSDVIQYPLILCQQVNGSTSVNGVNGSVLWSDYYGAAYIGNIKCRFDTASGENVLAAPLKAKSSVLPSNIENFNTTTCVPVHIYESNTAQFLGFCVAIYFCMYASDSISPETIDMPKLMQDINKTIVFIHDGSGVMRKENVTFIAMPIEEVMSA